MKPTPFPTRNGIAIRQVCVVLRARGILARALQPIYFVSTRASLLLRDLLATGYLFRLSSWPPRLSATTRFRARCSPLFHCPKVRSLTIKGLPSPFGSLPSNVPTSQGALPCCKGIFWPPAIYFGFQAGLQDYLRRHVFERGAAPLFHCLKVRSLTIKGLPSLFGSLPFNVPTSQGVLPCCKGIFWPPAIYFGSQAGLQDYLRRHVSLPYLKVRSLTISVRISLLSSPLPPLVVVLVTLALRST